ncbi:MAG: hypothetical protein ABI611_14630 [Solirubrobacteraceae bacterium]
MGRTWVLDTETKGTGAQMVPLDKVVETPENKPLFVPRKHRPKPPPETAPRAPRRFKVVDISTREVLSADAGARSTLALLGAIRSSVDVNVFVWEPSTEAWRLLTLREKRMLWERRTGTSPE